MCTVDEFLNIFFFLCVCIIFLRFSSVIFFLISFCFSEKNEYNPLIL